MQPQEYVGIDLHRRRSVIVRCNSEGETLEVSHVNNDDVNADRKGAISLNVPGGCQGFWVPFPMLEQEKKQEPPPIIICSALNLVAMTFGYHIVLGQRVRRELQTGTV
jgi:hypothetical protein